MSETRHSDIILDLDIDELNRLLTHSETSHNLDKAAIFELFRPLVRPLAINAAEADFKAIYEAWQAHQSDTNTGGT